MKKHILWGLGLLLIGVLVLGGCGGSNDNKITVGGKQFSEQDILVEIIKQTIEGNTDIQVDTKPFLGGTNVVASAIESGDLDIYVEYTGTGLLHILGLPPESNPDKAYEIVKREYAEKKNITWLKPLGFNNTYTLSMRADRAQELGVTTISDLIPLADQLSLGCEPEFMERPDSYPGLQNVYGLHFASTHIMDTGLMYGAVRDGQVDVIDAFATDGRIPAFNLVVLEDDKNFFPPYYAAPIVRSDTLKKHPELEPLLNKLGGLLNDEDMAKLNSQVDIEGKSPKEVAEAWLKSKNIIK